MFVKSTKAARASFKPELQHLEDRRVMSANLVGGNLVINQSNFDDTAVVRHVETPFGPGFIRVEETVAGVTQAPKLFFAPFVNRITYNGFAGDDVFDNLTDVKSTALGGSGDDLLRGGHNDDVLIGAAGNDQLHAREGNDYLYGNTGNDILRGGQGDDHLFGNSGFDDLFGALGDDYLDGGRDGIKDKLTGGAGADTFVAERVRVLFFTINRDRPTDFNAAEGDQIV
jgi:Ca2+-binding RTX toxin-like protein